MAYAGEVVDELQRAREAAEERRLVTSAADGSSAAFEQLYRRHVARIHALCLRMTGNVATAEDCMQEAFVQAWRNLGQFETRSTFGTWLHRIAVNTVLQQVRRRQELLRSGITGLANVHLTHDRPEQVLFQALLARGDRRLAAVLLDMVTRQLPWKQAMARQQLEVEQFVICGHDQRSVFPWDIVDHGISRSYLWREYRRAFAEKTSPPCDTAVCRRCGVCHGN